jgi:hypothetical protein
MRGLENLKKFWGRLRHARRGNTALASNTLFLSPSVLIAMNRSQPSVDATTFPAPTHPPPHFSHPCPPVAHRASTTRGSR